jgi:DNA-binding FadR family transcriptional regulator
VVHVAESDARFHDLVFARCGNRLFKDLHAQLRRIVEESQQVPMINRARLSEMALEHRRIANALRAGDAQVVRVLMEQHIVGAAGRAGVVI